MIRFLLLSIAAVPVGAVAQEMPVVDTEDAELSSAAVGDGRFHPTVTVDLRNGDFVRGDYDDDAARLNRLPVHVQVGFGYALRPDLFVVARSSNGFHAPADNERTRPRGWYESNNVVALVALPAKGLTTGLAYAIKTSPNGVADTTHELSFTGAYEGALNPTFVATVRPKGGGGLFTQAGIAPSWDLGDADDAPSVSLPIKVGVGWGGFYERGTGTRVYGSVGGAYAHPFTIGATKWQARAEIAALIRDDRLRRLRDRGEQGTVVPLGTIALTMAY